MRNGINVNLTVIRTNSFERINLKGKIYAEYAIIRQKIEGVPSHTSHGLTTVGLVEIRTQVLTIFVLCP